MAHRIAMRENRSVSEIVERALESYETPVPVSEPAAAFYERLHKECAADIDLEAIIRNDRRVHEGTDL